MGQSLTSKGFRVIKRLSLEWQGFKPQNVSIYLQFGREGFHCTLATGVKPAVTSLFIVKVLPAGRPHHLYWLNISRRNGDSLTDKCVNVSVTYIAIHRLMFKSSVIRIFCPIRKLFATISPNNSSVKLCYNMPLHNGVKCIIFNE